MIETTVLPKVDYNDRIKSETDRANPHRGIMLTSHSASGLPIPAKAVLHLLLLAVVGCKEDFHESAIDLSQAINRTIPAAEVFRVDGMAADLVPISPVGGVVLLKDGSVVFTQSQNHTLVYVTPTGSLLGSFGREGAGPGEFRIIVTLGTVGDTVWAWDGRLVRATLVAPTRTLIRNMKLPVNPKGLRGTADVEDTGNGPLHLVGLQADGTFLGLFFTGGGMTLVNARTDGTVLSTLPALTTRSDQHPVRIDNAEISGNPFDVVPAWDVSQDGAHVIVARPSYDQNNGATFSLTKMLAGGDSVFSRQYRIAGVAIPKSVVDSVLDAATSGMAKPAADAYRRKAYVPHYYPSVEKVVLGSDGVVFVQLRDAQDHRSWVLFTEEGEPVGRITLPERTNVAAGTRFVLLTLEENDVNVQSVVKYQLKN